MQGKLKLVIVGSGVAVLVLGAVWLWRRRRAPSKKKKGKTAAVPVGHISSIYLYPVKSTQGMWLDEVQCSNTGPCLSRLHLGDRQYVVTTKDYEYISLLTYPKMALIVPSIQGNDLHLDAPDMKTLKVPKPTDGPVHNLKVMRETMPGMDCGDEAGLWFATFLETPGLRLCYSGQDMSKRLLRDRPDPRNFRFLKDTKDTDQVIFHNLSPYMLLCNSSVEDFNKRVPVPVSATNFRPNFTISGTPPYDDDNWQELYIGDAEFSFIRSTFRCPRTQVDPSTGTKRADNEPLKTLRKYRVLYPDIGETASFGSDWVLERPGTVRLGDPVYAVRK